MKRVAFCDILGFRNLLTSAQAEEIVKDMKERFGKCLHNAIFHSSEPPKLESLRSFQNDSQVGVAWFSDSFVIYAKNDSLEASRRVMECANWLIFRTLFRSMFRLRVGIAHGELIVDEEAFILVGRALVDACELCGKQQWMGGALHGFACKVVETVMPSIYELPIEKISANWHVVPCHVPVKKEKR